MKNHTKSRDGALHLLLGQSAKGKRLREISKGMTRTLTFPEGMFMSLNSFYVHWKPSLLNNSAEKS